MLIIKNGTVIDTEPVPVVLGTADVRIVDGRIDAVGPALPYTEDAEVIDATGMIVMPGFVDGHRHTWQAGLRAAGGDMAFGDYLERVINGVTHRYRPEDVHAANLAGALECLDAGITTILDWSHIQLTPDHTDAAVDALLESGVRAVFGYCGTLETLRDEAARVSGRITTVLAARGPEFIGPEAAGRELEIARELGLPVSVHLRNDGLYGERTNYVHGAAFTGEGLKRIADSGGTLSVSPVVEARLGMGAPPIVAAQEAGVVVGLGADTVMCGPGDMFGIMRTTAMLPGLSTRDVLRMATIGGAQAAAVGHVTGSLGVGKQADLILMRTDLAGLSPVHDPIATVVLAADTRAVDTVLVGGKVVKRGGRLLRDDLPAALEALARSARDLAFA
ncbi:amidohydrolase family protein [Nonomuraea sp. NPDC050663]|uniref:amidohydrolase family protein n=1 Tax=Nonomuraea sp. NPDC050663 TaxID=3364370 RepID=UPI0037B17AA0